MINDDQKMMTGMAQMIEAFAKSRNLQTEQVIDFIRDYTRTGRKADRPNIFEFHCSSCGTRRGIALFGCVGQKSQVPSDFAANMVQEGWRAYERSKIYCPACAKQWDGEYPLDTELDTLLFILNSEIYNLYWKYVHLKNGREEI